MQLIHESINKNEFGNTMLLECNSKADFYGFRWKGMNNYLVQDCGTKEAVILRLEKLSILFANEPEGPIYKELLEKITI